MEEEKLHAHEDCNCEHHQSEAKNSHSCPTSQFVENLLKDLEIENEKKQD